MLLFTLFTLAPLAALMGSAFLAVRRSPSGPMADAQLPFLGVSNLIGGSPGTFALSGFLLLPGAFEPVTQFMLPKKGVLRSILVKNIQTGDDAIDILYKVRVNGEDVGLLNVKNNSGDSVSLNISQVFVEAEDLVSVLVVNPGFPGASPISKVVLLWRPL